MADTNPASFVASAYTIGTVMFIASVFVALAVADALLQHRADETCRTRVTNEGNVTLCRGEVYALNVLGEIECGCRKVSAP